MDILDLMAQMEKYGQIVAFAPHWNKPDDTVVVVKLDKQDVLDNRYYVVTWHEASRTDNVWHSSKIWTDAAESFGNVTTL